MNVFLVFAHPERASFVGALRDVAETTLRDAGHEVVVSDLYADGFGTATGAADFCRRANPDYLNVGAEQAHAAQHDAFAPLLKREMDRLSQADLVIFLFPMWWFSVPGILKAWIDSVLAYGVAYDFERTWNRGVYRGKRAMLAFTTGAPADVFAPDGRSGDLERVLWPLHGGVLALCGFEVLTPCTAWAVPWIDAQGREQILRAWATRLRGIGNEQPLFFHRLEDFGENRRLKPEIEPRTPAQHRGARKHLR